MSYSRWGSSKWYTFWCVQDEGLTETRDNAVFEICGITSFTAKQLRDNIEGCLKKVKDIEIEKFEQCPRPREMEELKEYMLEFLDDVNKEYPIQVL